MRGPQWSVQLFRSVLPEVGWLFVPFLFQSPKEEAPASKILRFLGVEARVLGATFAGLAPLAATDPAGH